MANSSQSHNLSLKYKFCYWFTKLIAMLWLTRCLLLWFVILPVIISCGIVTLRDQGWWEEGQKKKKVGSRSYFSCHSNNSFHFLQGLLQILGNWFMIQFALRSILCKEVSVGIKRQWSMMDLMKITLFLSLVYDLFFLSPVFPCVKNSIWRLNKCERSLEEILPALQASTP